MKYRLMITLVLDPKHREEGQLPRKDTITAIEAADGTAVDFEDGCVKVMGPDVALEVRGVHAIYITRIDHI